MPERNLALRRHVVPFTPVTIRTEQIGGGFEALDLKLAFDMNAAAALQEKTIAKHRPDGLSLTDLRVWNHVGEPLVFRAMLWAATLVHQPEYNTGDDQGLLTIGSFIQENNSQEIIEALWKAYLAFLPAKKRDILAKFKEEAERGETNRPLDVTKTAPNETIPSVGSSSGPSPDTISASASANSAS